MNCTFYLLTSLLFILFIVSVCAPQPDDMPLVHERSEACAVAQELVNCDLLVPIAGGYSHYSYGASTAFSGQL